MDYLLSTRVVALIALGASGTACGGRVEPLAIGSVDGSSLAVAPDGAPVDGASGADAAPGDGATGAIGATTTPDCDGCTFPSPDASVCASAPSIKVVYPPDTALLPPNLGTLSVQWVPYGAPFVRFEVDFTQSAQSPTTDWRIMTACSAETSDQLEAGSGGCEIAVDPTSWSRIAAANRGGAPVAITVRGTTDGACASTSEDTIHVSFAEEDLLGTYFYWRSEPGLLGGIGASLGADVRRCRRGPRPEPHVADLRRARLRGVPFSFAGRNAHARLPGRRHGPGLRGPRRQLRRLDGVAAPVVMSDQAWKSSTTEVSGWESPAFDDSAWANVQSLGGIESSIDLFQWNADAGLYDWPGYDGISPFLAHRRIPIREILSATQGNSSFDNLSALTASGSPDFAVHLSAPAVAAPQAPNLILDFGEEITGRLELISDSDSPSAVTIQYGESYDEMLKSPYLGINLLSIAPHQTAHGPKTSFRFAKVVFLSGSDLRFKSIAADDIFYPVKYQGSFESSDPLLNRIWETGAYTAHLCMQDGVWDSPKRDRGRWMGDTDVMGRTIEDVFDDHFLMEDTLDRLLGPAPVEQHVNGIPGYSAFWFTGVAQYYRQTGSKEFLNKELGRMLQLLEYVDKEFDAQDVYANKTNVWLFVDWSPELKWRHTGIAPRLDPRVLCCVSRCGLAAERAWRSSERRPLRAARRRHQGRGPKAPA